MNVHDGEKNIANASIQLKKIMLKNILINV